MNRRWLVNRTNREYLEYLSRSASISPILAQILINRGIKAPKDVIDFLRPGVTGLSDPYDIPDMRKAVIRIKSAIHGNEGILIHGDYDADGLTGTAILMEVLSKVGLEVHYFIPDRFTHGYGFSVASVDMAKRLGMSLIITVDCGITSMETVAYAKREGIDVIITDHHEPLYGKEGMLPDAVAVVNPKLINSSMWPDSLAQLSGAGVALKLVQALIMEKVLPLSDEDFLSLFDLATLGAVADMVPLIRENRIILKEGLSFLAEDKRLGLKALREISGLRGRDMKAGILSFTIIPRINSAGRMGDANHVVKLFLSRSEDEAWRIAESLNSMNLQRQAVEAEIYEEALEEINKKGVGPVIVLSNSKWHQGVLGIVASRIADEFYRPTFLFTIEGDVARGSARSIPFFDIHGGLSRCSDLLLSFGGHKQAAGLRLLVSNLPIFEETIGRIVKEGLSEEDFVKVLKIDSEVWLNEINNNLINEFSMLEPFGYGNPEPILGARMLNAVNPRIVGNNHLKMMLRQKDVMLDAVGFSMGDYVDDIISSQSLDVAFTPTINEWNGARHLQMNLKAIRPKKV